MVRFFKLKVNERLSRIMTDTKLLWKKTEVTLHEAPMNLWQQWTCCQLWLHSVTLPPRLGGLFFPLDCFNASSYLPPPPSLSNQNLFIQQCQCLYLPVSLQHELLLLLKRCFILSCFLILSFILAHSRSYPGTHTQIISWIISPSNITKSEKDHLP